MSPIAPALIPSSREHLEDTLRTISLFTREIQVDIVDGIFVPFTSWPYTEKDTLEALVPFTQELIIEVDLMIERPEEVILSYIEAGVRRIVIHRESTQNLDQILSHKDRHDFKLGLSINNDTPLHELTDYVSQVDYIQLMGIARIGSQGQPFDVRVIERIKEIRKNHPHILISIDGSVNTETVQPLIRAGADRCVAGSAILGAEDPREAYETLVSLCREVHTNGGLSITL